MGGWVDQTNNLLNILIINLSIKNIQILCYFLPEQNILCKNNKISIEKSKIFIKILIWHIIQKSKYDKIFEYYLICNLFINECKLHI